MSRFHTPPDLLSSLPATVASALLVALPGLRECRGIAGRLNVEQIKQLGIKTPAVLVSRLRMRQDKTYAGPHHSWRVQMAAFILCKDELGLPRDQAATNIAQVLLAVIPENQWGIPDHVMPAEAIAEEPLVSLEANKQGLALTAITWDHVIALTPFAMPEQISPELYLGQQPQIGADHLDDYEQIRGTP